MTVIGNRISEIKSRYSGHGVFIGMTLEPVFTTQKSGFFLKYSLAPSRLSMGSRDHNKAQITHNTNACVSKINTHVSKS